MVMTEWALAAKLAAKKSKVREAVKGIIKTGTNQSQHYKYAEEPEVLVAVRKAMIDVGLDFSMEASAAEITHQIPTKSGQMNHFLVHQVCTLTDIETGYQERSPWLGSAADSGDKAICKAYTSGLKYFLMKTFLLPTGDDLEAFGDVDEPPKAQQKAPAKQPAKPEPTEIVTDNKVLNDAWTAFQQTHAGKIPNGYVWDFGRFQAAIKGRCKNRLPKADSNVAEVTAFVQANIPPIECWRAPDEAKAAA